MAAPDSTAALRPCARAATPTVTAGSGWSESLAVDAARDAHMTTDESAARRDSFNERRNQPFSEMRAMLGKSVVVTLDWDDEKAVMRGTLRSLTEDGEVCVVGEDGICTYGWPCLYIEELP